jgi:hypothetical protein
MDAIEPHWISLLFFAALLTVCTLSFLVVAGMFPLRSRPDSLKSNGGLVLVTGNALLLAALSVGTAYFGYSELRWTTLVVVAGLVVLFAPGLFEIWPASYRDGSKGLAVMMGVQLLALATLTKLASPAWVNDL